MLSKSEILSKLEASLLRPEDAKRLLNKIEQNNKSSEPDKFKRKTKQHPPKFKVAKTSGWLSVYFAGLRRPCSLPSVLWLELLQNADQLQAFIQEHRAEFKNKM